MSKVDELIERGNLLMNEEESEENTTRKLELLLECVEEISSLWDKYAQQIYDNMSKEEQDEIIADARRRNIDIEKELRIKI